MHFNGCAFCIETWEYSAVEQNWSFFSIANSNKNQPDIHLSNTFQFDAFLPDDEQGNTVSYIPRFTIRFFLSFFVSSSSWFDQYPRSEQKVWRAIPYAHRLLSENSLCSAYSNVTENNENVYTSISQVHFNFLDIYQRVNQIDFWQMNVRIVLLMIFSDIANEYEDAYVMHK